jgi:hypothetical protein
MDAGLAWTVAGSVAGAAGAVFAGVQVWQSRHRTEPAPAPELPGGLTGPAQAARAQVRDSQGIQLRGRVLPAV